MAVDSPEHVSGQNGNDSKSEEQTHVAKGTNKREDESDEEGEIKEAGGENAEGGSMRDLREEIEAKRGRKRPANSLERRTEEERAHQAEGYYNNVGRRYEDGQGMMNGSNGHHDIGMRREDLRRGAHPRGFDQDLEFRRGGMGGFDEGMARRRPLSPHGPREPMMMRRASPPLRRMPSPPPMRRFPPDRFNPDFRNPRDFEGRGMMMDPRDRDFIPEISPRFGPGRERDVGFPPDRGAVARTCTVRISNLPHPQDVSSERLRADLLEESSMHGRIVEFQLHERDAFVTFVEPSMAENARRQMHRTVMHNAVLEVELDLSAPPPRGDGPPMNKDAPLIRRKPELFDDMDDPLATCRISVDQVGEGVTEAEVASHFKSFGVIDSVAIRRNRGQTVSEIKFRSFSSAVRAKREMDGRRLWQTRSRVDFCMGPASCELWLGSVHGSVTEQQLVSEMGRFGKVADVRLHRNSKCAYVAYERTEDAQTAAEAMRGRTVGNSSWRLKVDFWERPEGAPGRGGERRVASNAADGRGERGPGADGRGERGPAAERGECAVTVQMRAAVSNKALAMHFLVYGNVQSMDRTPDGLSATVRFSRPEDAQKALRDEAAAAAREKLGIEVKELARNPPPKRIRDDPDGDGNRKRLHVEVPVSARDRGGATPPSFTPTPTGRGGWAGGYSEPLTTQGRVASGGSTPLVTGSAPLTVERKVASGGSTPTARQQSQPLDAPPPPPVPKPPRRSDSTMSMDAEQEGRGPALQPAVQASRGGEGGAGPGPVGAGKEGHGRVEGEGGSAVPRNGERMKEEAGGEKAKSEAGGGGEVLDMYPVVWPGAVAIKGAAVGIRLHALGGEGDGLVSLLTGDKVTVTRRMKLEAEQLKDFTATLRSWKKENSALLLATPSDRSATRQAFDSQLVKYLTERNAAGVVQLEGSAMMYLFPPTELAREHLLVPRPEVDTSQLESFLLVVLAKG